MENIVFSPDLTIADNVVLENLSGEIEIGLLGANLESLKGTLVIETTPSS